MVSTRGKKKTASSNKILEENDAAENGIAGPLTVDVEEPKMDAQLEDKVELTVEEAINEKDEEMDGGKESEKVAKVDNDDDNTIWTEMNSYDVAELEKIATEDDEVDDDEDVIWEDHEEDFEEENEENVADDYEVSEEEATEEEDGEDDISEEEATEEDNDEDEISAEAAKEQEVNEQNTQEQKEIAKGDGREAKSKENGNEADRHKTGKVEGSKHIKKSSEKSRKVRAGRLKKVELRDKPESSRKRKVKKRVDSMGMIFMCSSKTKDDCYQYRVLGLPESKKDIVEKIYTGMRLFLYDVDRKLMYGIYKAAGPGGYNIEPKAFKSQFPSQVRFTVLDDCLPLAEEKFKKVIKDNYFTNTKFDCQLNSEQVRKLCKLFIASSKGQRSKKLGRRCKAEKHHPVLRERTRRRKAGDGRRLALRDELLRYDESPRKRPRKVISPVPPLRQPPPSNVHAYAYERTSDLDVYRRDPYLERRSPYRDRRDPLLDRRDLYRDGRDPPTERHDHYRDGRDPYLDRHYRYRDGRDPYIERYDPYRDGRDTYPERRDPYKDRRDSYLERRDSYKDRGDSYLERLDPYIESRDSYRDARDMFVERRGPYRDGIHSDPYSTYRRDLRDPISDGRGVYREERRVENSDYYREEEPLERRSHALSLETRDRHDIGSRDSYVSYRERPLYTEPIYSAEYPYRAGLAREYRL
ncbi:uncharacterized protein LOC105170420 [Sesamum indicum]|uniref:Uncharacterized protein LOC105170420 n=1 Tax=Sesamum indicum TaxID=4182 RepID=A0A6I9TZH7_SESIN|nr:uncharacterized protein LOC105170420 [Sesamum indicum]